MAVVSGGSKLNGKLRDIAARYSTKEKLRVGFLEGTARAGSDMNYPTIAAIQNFGAPAAGIPPRPFFTNFISDNKDGWPETAKRFLRLTKGDGVAALEMLGERLAGQLRQSIVNITDPPLSPVTLLLRQRFGNNPQAITFGDVMDARRDVRAGAKAKVTPTQAKPLIWTGGLLGAVDAEVS